VVGELKPTFLMAFERKEFDKNISTDHTDKNGVIKSNDDVISGLPRPLMVEIASGLLFAIKKSSITRQW
jgi:hypothetical protein